MRNSVPISDVAEINPRPPKWKAADRARRVAFVPMAAVSEEGCLRQAETRELGQVAKGYTYFEQGDVLFAKITPCMENGKAALLTCLPERIGFGSTEFHVLRPGPKIDAQYLFHMVWNPAIRFAAARNMTGTAGQKRVPSTFFERYQIPLPSLVEQRRIATILDKADTIRRKRQQSIQLADEFLRSVFLEMFGGAKGVAAGWPTQSIDALLAKRPGAIRTGPFGSQLKHSEFVDKGVPVLGIDNVVTNRFRWTTPRCLPVERFDEFGRFTVFPRDLIVTIMGTTGRACVAPADLPACMSTKHLCVVSLDEDLATPWYVWGCLLFDERVRAQARTAGGGAIMEGWNMGVVRNLVIRVPPREIQARFELLVERKESLANLFSSGIAAANALVQSLGQRALRGEL